MNQGYVQVYTGNGKGKTTAAFGLALRSVCAGNRVYIGQFVKGQKYSELNTPQYLPNITIEQFGRGCFIFKEPTPDDVEAAKKGLKRVTEVIHSGQYDLVVLDEINIALYYQLFSADEVLELLKIPHEAEVILTGRYAPQQLIDFADLVTEMKEIKHYYKKGVSARKGIEN
ncbi:MAG: cob(I)yrinic acid a,c-diamide adenosyltransferase [Spirochaetes bacterium]|nr:cob(I)yrinic acid a,c-diamide adenosyltransferase [Spirochaetota bacterium]